MEPGEERLLCIKCIAEGEEGKRKKMGKIRRTEAVKGKEHE